MIKFEYAIYICLALSLSCCTGKNNVQNGRIIMIRGINLVLPDAVTTISPNHTYTVTFTDREGKKISLEGMVPACIYNKLYHSAISSKRFYIQQNIMIFDIFATSINIPDPPGVQDALGYIKNTHGLSN